MTNGQEVLDRLRSDAGRADPSSVYRELHDLGQVAEVADGSLVAYSYDAVGAVLRCPTFGRTDPPVAAGRLSMLLANPPDHARIRGSISDSFTPRRIHDLGAVIEEEVDRLITKMRGSHGADFMADFAYPLPLNVICRLLGIRVQDRERLRSVAHDLTVLLEMQWTEQDFKRLARSQRALHAYCARLLQSRQSKSVDNLISDLAASSLTEGEKIGNLAFLLIAGFETMAGLLGNGLMTLSSFPGQCERMAERPGSFVEEFLRCDPPVNMTKRMAMVPSTLVGRPVKEGTVIFLLIGAANRDPHRYSDPDRFDPDRPGSSLSFGAGPHYCLGASLARLQAQIAFPALLRHLPGLRLAGRPVRKDRIGLRAFQSLPVTWETSAVTSCSVSV